MANKKHYYNNKNRKPKGDATNNNNTINAQVAKYSEAQLMMSLSELGLCETTCTLLESNKITKSADLVKRSEKDMYKVQGLNKRILFEVKDALKKNGMCLCPIQDNKKPQNANQDNGKKKSVDSEKNLQSDESKGEEKKSKFGLVDRPKTNNGQKTPKQTKQNQQKQKQDKPQKQEKLTEPLKAGQWRKVLKGGKWGYSDGFKIVIPTMYDEIFAFKEGLASVEINEKCGYINEQNEVIIPLDYDTAMSFSEGLAMVVKGDKCGYINQNNEVVIPFEYDAGTPFEDGEAKIKKDGKWGTITKNGKVTWI